MKILVFGDSIAFGVWDKKGGWVQKLREFFDEKTLDKNTDFYCLTFNLGISGNTTQDLLERFEFELKQRIDEELLIIFEVGINDSGILDETKEFWVPPEKFEENIKNLIGISKKYTNKIIFLGLTPVEESKVSPFHGGKDIYYKNENIKKYNNIIKSVCEDNKIYFIELIEKWDKMNYFKLLEDGLHPNSEGHEKIYEIVKEFLIKNEVIL